MALDCIVDYLSPAAHFGGNVTERPSCRSSRICDSHIDMATAHVYLWLWPLFCEGIKISQKSWLCILCLPPGPCNVLIGLVSVTNQDHDPGSTDVMQLRADVVHIISTLRVMKTVICVLCVMVIILLLQM
ncbi:uncharacterized protein LOC114310981 isoform X2 [Camellia sinensis]|uniref:uncharacterized protein LOC114310981 isoform X2 n=1 Tax=Camellia sinensis TaxID=4442 RepID=UPI0010358CFD|nr:uncharacterized protein LOC114310981 isoform X2 [Camellia sinensis]